MPRPVSICLVIAAAAVLLGGGTLIGYGARVAGGCTSGHGIWLGIGEPFTMTLAVAAMFAGGILTATLLMRRA